jgi:membrane protein implicated in regulation of membrane protease activity
MGALITAVFIWLGMTPGINSQLVCFVVSSTVTAMLFRRTVKKMFGKRTEDV